MNKKKKVSKRAACLMLCVLTVTPSVHVLYCRHAVSVKRDKRMVIKAAHHILSVSMTHLFIYLCIWSLLHTIIELLLA